MRGNLSGLLTRIRTGVRALDSSYEGGDMAGAFFLTTHTGAQLKIISSGSVSYAGSQGWEHVSVSLIHRTPSWEEMCIVKRLFWRDDECVIQYHPPESEYVNVNPNVLHLWKPPYPVPLPPKEFV